MVDPSRSAEPPDDIVDVLDSRAEPLRRIGQHQLTIADDDQLKLALEVDLLLYQPNKFPTFDVEEGACLGERQAASRPRISDRGQARL
jgi:hypothetical protein